MRVLHTSDWHLGRTLYGRKRYDEFSSFLSWLIQTLGDESIDILLVAGDIFDTSTPSDKAQELYYRFLCRVAETGCRHVVIIGGNHDSPSFLNAPKELLEFLDVHVVGALCESLEDEVLVLCKENQPEAIICAVPYLRDKDIRTTEPGETIEDKNAKIVTGLKNHYASVCEIAEKKCSEILEEFKIEIPIIGMGHLFTDGSKVVEGDGVRELYIGSLAHVDVEIFPSVLDYVALGHLHVPQVVSNKDTIRYSGSPIPMGFGEANQQKIVVIVEFTDRQPTVKTINIPCFQQLVRIQGSLDQILLELKKLKENDSDAWLEIEFTGEDIFDSLSDTLNEIIANSKMEIRRIKNRRIIERLLNNIALDEALDDLDVTDIFSRCLDAYEIPGDERPELIARYEDVVKRLQEEDLQAQ